MAVDYISWLSRRVSICRERKMRRDARKCARGSQVVSRGGLLCAKDRSEFVSNLSGAGKISWLEGNCRDPRVTTAAKFFRQ